MIAGVSFTTVLAAIGIAAVASLAGGTLGGIVVGGKDIGNEVAAMLGAFYGPMAGLVGVVIGVAVLSFL